MNRPPSIVHPDPETSPVPLFVFNNDFHNVYAVANDPEDDILTFVWDIPRANTRPVAETWTENGLQHSSIDVPKEWLRDGETFQVRISDTQNIVAVQWIVVEQ